jgi:hypothetical protein
MSSALSNGAQDDPPQSPRVTARDSRRSAKRYWASCLCPGCRPLIGKWQDICFAEGCGTRPAHCAFCWISGATATQSNGRAPKQPVSRARACTQGRPRTRITANGSSTKNTPHMSDTPPKSPLSRSTLRRRARSDSDRATSEIAVRPRRVVSVANKVVEFDLTKKTNRMTSLGLPTHVHLPYTRFN